MTPETIRANFEARQNAVAELRSLCDNAAGREFTGEEQATEARLNAAINEMDARIKNGLDSIDRERAADEARARIDALGGSTPPPAVNGDAAKLARFVKGEVRSVDFAHEVRDLSKLSATAGLNTVPTSFYAQLVEHMIENSSVMQGNATIIRTAGGEALQVPKTNSYSSAALIAEAGSITESDPAFGQVTLDAFKYAFMTQLSTELLVDNAVDVMGFLARQGGVALGNGLGAALVAGDGSSKPNGIFTAATTGVTAAGATTVTGDELIDLYHSIVTGYRSRASWIMKDASLKVVRKLKDSTGQYLWQPGLVAGQPDNLLGRPVFTDPNAPAMTTGLDSILFGDLSGYYVRLAGAVRVERSDDFAFGNDLVSVRFILRGDGDLIDTASVRVLTQA